MKNSAVSVSTIAIGFSYLSYKNELKDGGGCRGGKSKNKVNVNVFFPIKMNKKKSTFKSIRS